MGLFLRLMNFFNKSQDISFQSREEKSEVETDPIIVPKVNNYNSTVEKAVVKMYAPKSMKIVNLVINIGIDFGTSFTKVCFSEGRTSQFIDFDGIWYKDSIVYYNYKENTFLFSKPESLDNIEEIKYFKYSMIDDKLPKGKRLQELNITIKPEILCSIFFLACIIKESKEKISRYYKKQSINFSIEWNITLGVPIDNYENEKQKNSLYDRIIHIANILSEQLSTYTISIDPLYKLYKMKENMEIPKFGTSFINTLPELYAESFAFLKDDNLSALNGVYAIIDIGGATVDMAIISKEGNEDFSVISKTIIPVGIEIVSNSVISDRRYADQIKAELKTRNNLNVFPYVVVDKEESLKEQLRSSFAAMVMDLKVKNREILENMSNGVLKIIICGGGANHKWYEDGIRRNEQLLRPTLPKGLKLSIEPVELLIKGTEIKNLSHRQIISYILSKPVGEYLTELKGYPWHFEDIKPTTPNYNDHDRYMDMQDIQKERYGEPV